MDTLIPPSDYPRPDSSLSFQDANEDRNDEDVIAEARRAAQSEDAFTRPSMEHDLGQISRALPRRGSRATIVSIAPSGVDVPRPSTASEVPPLPQLDLEPFNTPPLPDLPLDPLPPPTPTPPDTPPPLPSPPRSTRRLPSHGSLRPSTAHEIPTPSNRSVSVRNDGGSRDEQAGPSHLPGGTFLSVASGPLARLGNGPDHRGPKSFLSSIFSRHRPTSSQHSPSQHQNVNDSPRSSSSVGRSKPPPALQPLSTSPNHNRSHSSPSPLPSPGGVSQSQSQPIRAPPPPPNGLGRSASNPVASRGLIAQPTTEAYVTPPTPTFNNPTPPQPTSIQIHRRPGGLIIPAQSQPQPALDRMGLVLSSLTPNMSLSRYSQPLCGAILDGKFLLIGTTSGLDFLPIPPPTLLNTSAIYNASTKERRPIGLIKKCRFRQMEILSERSNILLAIAGRNDHIRVYGLESIRTLVHKKIKQIEEKEGSIFGLPAKPVDVKGKGKAPVQGLNASTDRLHSRLKTTDGRTGSSHSRLQSEPLIDRSANAQADHSRRASITSKGSSSAAPPSRSAPPRSAPSSRAIPNRRNSELLSSSNPRRQSATNLIPVGGPSQPDRRSTIQKNRNSVGPGFERELTEEESGVWETLREGSISSSSEGIHRPTPRPPPPRLTPREAMSGQDGLEDLRSLADMLTNTEPPPNNNGGGVPPQPPKRPLPPRPPQPRLQPRDPPSSDRSSNLHALIDFIQDLDAQAPATPTAPSPIPGSRNTPSPAGPPSRPPPIRRQSRSAAVSRHRDEGLQTLAEMLRETEPPPTLETLKPDPSPVARSPNGGMGKPKVGRGPTIESNSHGALRSFAEFLKETEPDDDQMNPPIKSKDFSPKMNGVTRNSGSSGYSDGRKPIPHTPKDDGLESVAEDSVAESQHEVEVEELDESTTAEGGQAEVRRKSHIEAAAAKLLQGNSSPAGRNRSASEGGQNLGRQPKARTSLPVMSGPRLNPGEPRSASAEVDTFSGLRSIAAFLSEAEAENSTGGTHGQMLEARERFRSRSPTQLSSSSWDNFTTANANIPYDPDSQLTGRPSLSVGTGQRDLDEPSAGPSQASPRPQSMETQPSRDGTLPSTPRSRKRWSMLDSVFRGPHPPRSPVPPTTIEPSSRPPSLQDEAGPSMSPPPPPPSEPGPSHRPNEAVTSIPVPAHLQQDQEAPQSTDSKGRPLVAPREPPVASEQNVRIRPLESGSVGTFGAGVPEYVKLARTKGARLIRAVETRKRTYLAVLCGENGERVELFTGSRDVSLSLNRTFVLPETPRTIEFQLQGDDLVDIYLIYDESVFALEPATIRVREVGVGRNERRAARRERERQAREAASVSGNHLAPDPLLGNPSDAPPQPHIESEPPLPNPPPLHPSDHARGQPEGDISPGLTPSPGPPGQGPGPRSNRSGSRPGTAPTPQSRPPPPPNLPGEEADRGPVASQKSPTPYTTFQQLAFLPPVPPSILAASYVIPPTYEEVVGSSTPDSLPATPGLSESENLLSPISLLSNPTAASPGPPGLFFVTRAKQLTGIVDAEGRSIIRKPILWFSENFDVPRPDLRLTDMITRVEMVVSESTKTRIVGIGPHDIQIVPVDGASAEFPFGRAVPVLPPLITKRGMKATDNFDGLRDIVFLGRTRTRVMWAERKNNTICVYSVAARP